MILPPFRKKKRIDFDRFLMKNDGVLGEIYKNNIVELLKH